MNDSIQRFVNAADALILLQQQQLQPDQLARIANTLNAYTEARQALLNSADENQDDVVRSPFGSSIRFSSFKQTPD